MVLPGIAGGDFGPASSYGTGTNPIALAVGDLNGDGILDVAAPNSSSSNLVTVLLGLPGGGFGTVTSFPVGTSPHSLNSIAIGDMDGDGRNDLIVGRLDDSATVLYGLAGGGFGPNTDFPTNGRSDVVAVADLNGDARLDLVSTNDSGVTVYYGLPGGSLGGRTDFVIPGDINGLALGDLNGDGRPDIVTGTYLTLPGILGSVATLLGLPGGGFGPPTTYQTGGGTSLVAIGDLDADGSPEIAGAGFDGNFVSVVWSRPGGGFLASPYYDGGASHFGIAVGDLNGDARPDIAVPNALASLPNPATVLTRIPGDGFAAVSYGAAKVARSIATGDLNGDGIPDLVLANSGAAPTTNPGTVSILLGLPGGGYGPNTDYGVGVNPLDVKLSDLDGDGRLDIVTANSSSNDVSVLLGQMGGGFGPETRYPAGFGTTAVGVGDFDADGRPDLAALNVTNLTVSILLGLAGGGFGAPTSYATPSAPGVSIAIADLNADGNLDLAVASRISTAPGTIGKASVYLGSGGGVLSPRTDYSAGFGANTVAAGDLDGDGILDLAVGCQAGNAIAVLLGLPGGGYGPSTSSAAISPRALAIGDMDGDERPDLGTAGLSIAGVIPNIGPALAVNHAPAITAASAATVPTGTPVHLMATAFDADALQKVTITSTVSPPAPWLLQSGGGAAALPVVTASRAGTPGASDGGTYVITWTATDNASPQASLSRTTTVTVIGSVDHAPVVTAPSSVNGAEGSPLSFAVTASDPDGEAITNLSASGTAITSGATFTTGPSNMSGTLSWTPSYIQAGTYSVTFTASNALSGSATTTLTIANTNLAPVVSIGTPPAGAVFRVGTPVAFSGSFTDDAGDTHTASWKFDAITVAGAVNEGTRSASATYTFAAAGVYKVSLVVTDNLGASGTATKVGGVDATVVIYNPNGMVISGVGWINSPAGAYVPSPGSTGKGAFAFAAGYKIGASVPTGATSFEFKAGNMTFLSASCDWLVISGSRGQYKGSGKVNLAGSYGFLLTVIDGQISGGGGIDKIRMKIWNKATGAVLYDTQPLAQDNAAPTIALAGGAIAILPPGSAAAAITPTLADVEAAPAQTVLLSNWPNPFNPETSIAYEVAEPSMVRVQVFDARGRLVATLVNSVPGVW